MSCLDKNYNFCTQKGNSTSTWKINWRGEDISTYDFELIFTRNSSIVKTLSIGKGLTRNSQTEIEVDRAIENMQKGVYDYEFIRTKNSIREKFLEGQKIVE